MELKKILSKTIRRGHSENKIDLLSFSPQKMQKSNQYVLEQLKVATSIKNRQDNNIALDGDYGTGKSSILYTLKKDLAWRTFNRPKTISFLSFLSGEEINSKFLQSEIVKQLYYGEQENKLKGSGYRRIGRRYMITSIPISMTLVSILLCTVYNIDIFTFIRGLVKHPNLIIDNFHLPTFIIITAVIIVLALPINTIFQFILNGNIKSISTKDLSIELSDSQPDFNQLIDLIIYYFRKTKRRVIIFEDLDRLNDPEIFEELRQLNFTLNNRFRPYGTIKFIYAIRSDLFLAETQTSKRAKKESDIEKINTKVFDLIIPVIPFLTKVNFSYIVQMKTKEVGLGQKIAGIENILSRHTSDMRVVKAVINNILTYQNNFDLQTADYKDVAALAIIRVFTPSDYMKLSTGDSLLDFVREQCEIEKKEHIEKIIEKRTPEYKIREKSESIWKDIRQYQEVPQDATVQDISIGNSPIPKDGDELVQIYKAKQDSNIAINWGYYHRTTVAETLQDIITSYTRADPSLMSIEKEVNQLAEQDCLKFYNDSIDLAKKGDDEKTQKIVKDLLKNDFVTESYTRFITQATDISADTDKALRYIYSYIRNTSRNAEYPINHTVAAEIMKRIDNTDLMSAGMYNFDLINFIIENVSQYSQSLEVILQYAKADLDLFMDFFDKYCHKYESALKIDTEKTSSPMFLARKLAKIYPKKLITKIAHSSLNDETCKKILADTAITNFDNPQDLILEDKKTRAFLNDCIDTILKSKDGKENWFKLFAANSVPINNLGDFEASDNDVKSYLNKILIVINEDNLKIIDDSTLEEYIKTCQLTVNDFNVIIKSNKIGTKQYVVKNIKNSVLEDELPKCIQQSLDCIYRERISLTVDEIIQYIEVINSTKMKKSLLTEFIVKTVTISKFNKEDIMKITSICNDDNLSKLNIKNSIIKLPLNKDNLEFAEYLQSLGLAKRQNSNKNTQTIRLQVLGSDL